ncbi:MAG TPA: potassium channel protein [Syntrophobacteraceae bacterium]|nr:potassium channel protein [Syntrophobacteraceae bacterium]
MPDSKSPHLILTDRGLAAELLERLVVPILMVGSVFIFGTVGFFIIGETRWSLLECAYMTSITLTTVGYGEVLEFMGANARIFAMVLMWTGMGVTLYAVSTITAFLVEKNLRTMLRERRMEKQIAALKGHYIVCGAGKTGFNVVKELRATQRACVVLDNGEDRLHSIQKHFKDLFYLCGEPTEEELLRRAGIEKAAGIIAVLNDDSHNLLITVQARFINPEIKIVTRCTGENLEDKFFRAGANYVVNPAYIGGLRLASEMIRPHVVSFLDRMLRSKDQSIRLEEVTLGAKSPWVGLTIGQTEVYRHTGLIPVALKHPHQEEFFYNPPQSEVLCAGTVLIVIGNSTQLEKLRRYAEA